MLNNITGILSTMSSMSIPLILAALGGCIPCAAASWRWALKV